MPPGLKPHAMRFVLAFVAAILVAPAAAVAAPALVPQPLSLRAAGCTLPLAAGRSVALPASADPGGREIVTERWTQLGIAAPRAGLPVSIVRAAGTDDGGYALDVAPGGVRIRVTGGDGEFNALATLAQLPERRAGGWVLPCVAIADAPALRWRIAHDDISRGPFPTMHYFEERIRTLAGFKYNGYSPYMEHVFDDPAHPLVASPERLTSAELGALARYARRFHVTVIPEQQTFAHMHESLKWEELAPLADLPHGWLLAASEPATYAYLEPLLRAELAAAGPVPFFHLGFDEPIDLGRGRTLRSAAVLAAHVRRVAAVVLAAGARPVIWDDAIQSDPALLRLLPPQTVVATFHYGAEPSFAAYIATVDRAGFDQLVSPGANNWNEIYADLSTAYANEARFLADAKAAHSRHVLGMLMTVWHDDGESLFEATWAPLAFAAATAWQREPVDRAAWHRTFARAFFGSDDPGFGSDLDALLAIRDGLRTKPESDPPNYLFWADPFDARVHDRLAAFDVAAVRRRAEAVATHLALVRPPLHANAADVMALAALRFDALARKVQIGTEVPALYDEARRHAAAHDEGVVYRNLNLAKYLNWEWRDALLALQRRYVAAWDYESRPGARGRVEVRYALAAQDAVRNADRLNAVQREDYLRAGTLPPFAELLGRPR